MLKPNTAKLMLLSLTLSGVPIDPYKKSVKDLLNKKEIVPDNGHLTNFSVPVKSWLLEENLQPLPDYTSIILTTI